MQPKSIKPLYLTPVPDPWQLPVPLTSLKLLESLLKLRQRARSEWTKESYLAVVFAPPLVGVIHHQTGQDVLRLQLR